MRVLCVDATEPEPARCLGESLLRTWVLFSPTPPFVDTQEVLRRDGASSQPRLQTARSWTPRCSERQQEDDSLSLVTSAQCGHRCEFLSSDTDLDEHRPRPPT